MKTRHFDRIGNGGMDFTELGFGTAPLGNLYRAISDDDAHAVLEAAWAGGCRTFDTAPLYGAGRSEILLGTALRGVPRDSYVLATKIGRTLPAVAGSMPFDYSREAILRTIEGSLERLGTDRIDILHIHDPDDHREEALASAFPVLAELRSQGVIGAIDDFKGLPVELLKPKTAGFVWEFMFARSLHQTPDMIQQHHILTEIARLVDAGLIRSPLTENLGAMSVETLLAGHRRLESGTTIGKIALDGIGG